MAVKDLAEAIIVQAMADLWDLEHETDSRRFFAGSSYVTCADLAGWNSEQRVKMLFMLLTGLTGGGNSSGRQRLRVRELTALHSRTTKVNR